MVAFNDIGTGLRTPFVAVEFDATRASQGPALLSYRALLIGQKISGGTATADALYRITSADQALTYGGRGSQLHRMALAWFASNTSTEVWIGVLDDDGSAVSAQDTITVTGPATAAGTIALYLGGVRVTVAVADGDAQNDIAAAINTAINANADLPVTSSVSTNVVTVTQRNGGLTGNAYDIRDSYRDGEALPTGVSLAYDLAATAGTTAPDLTNLIAAMGDTWFQVIAHPYTDATSLTAIEAEIADRNGPLRMIDGVAITSVDGSHSSLVTLGDGRNSEFSTIVAQPGANPLTIPAEFAAETAALAARYGAIDPARPFQTLRYSNALAPAETDLFTLQERNLLLFDGIATSEVAAGGVVQVGRLITTYQTNGAGADDTAYLDVTTRLTLLYLRFSFRTRMQTRFPRHKLADDGVRLGSGQVVMTPSLGKAEALNWFRDMESLGLVENFDQFKTDLVVERNDVDPNRLDFLLPPDLINSLIVTAAQIQFRL